MLQLSFMRFRAEVSARGFVVPVSDCLTILIFERMKRDFKHGGYVPPFIEAECVCCESGFADSLLSYDETPSMPYGDDKEQWF